MCEEESGVSGRRRRDAAQRSAGMPQMLSFTGSLALVGLLLYHRRRAALRSAVATGWSALSVRGEADEMNEMVP